MPSGPVDFKFRNVSRALKAALASFKEAGIPIGRAEIDARTGYAVVHAKDTPHDPASSTAAHDADSVVADRIEAMQRAS
jgi:hypothetical protein